MKKITLLLITGLFSLGISAQSFGLKGGYNIANVSATGDFGEYASPISGIVFGAFAQFGEDAIKYTAEMSYTQRGTELKIDWYSNNQNELTYLGTETVEEKWNYIDFSFLGNFHITDEIAINVGPYLGYLVGGKVTRGGYDSNNFKEGSIDEWDEYNRSEFGGAFGMSYWVNDQLLVDLRYTMAFSNVFEGTYDDGSTLDISNRGIQVSVGYLFTY